MLGSVLVQIGKVLLASAVALTFVLFAINTVCMLISPRAWFRLPGWLRAQGTLTPERYADGWGAIQVRITGALLLGLLIWGIFELFHSK
jgi:hypothetical protein